MGRNRTQDASGSMPTPPRGLLRLSEPVVDALLGGRLLKAAKRIRSGESVPLPTQIRWSEEQAAIVRDGLQEWLRTGDFDHLYQLLEKLPTALAHPAVTLLVARLRQLAGRAEAEWVLGDTSEAYTCTAAEQTLRRLGAAVMSGLFQTPGWNVEPPRRRGRPRRSLSDMIEAQEILSDYENVLTYLQERRQSFKRNRGESEERWVIRLAESIHRAWAESGIGTAVEIEGVRSETPPKTDAPADLFDDTPVRITKRPLSLPDQVTNKIAQEAPRLFAYRRPIFDHIAYSLVGHRRGVASRTIKHYVEVARRS